MIDHSVAGHAVCGGGVTRNACRIYVGTLVENVHLDNSEEVRGEH